MIVFSDLDGTLLDRDSYSYAQAEPAITHLRERGIRLVLVTSKTRAEVEALRAEMGNTDPFIVENGAAAVIPERGEIRLGATAAEARDALRRASNASGVHVRGFGEMSIAEICERSGLTPDVAELAARREYGEPFAVVAGDVAALTAALEELGYRVTRGGRFFHVLGGYDKGRAVAAVAERLDDTDTVGLGDAPNDIGFLKAVRQAVIIPSPHLDAMRAALPEAIVAQEPGPAGWNRAVLALARKCP
ncbi:MAG: HAD-IIB family hydrolase [Bryobacteraceae bacterium]